MIRARVSTAAAALALLTAPACGLPGAEEILPGRYGDGAPPEERGLRSAGPGSVDQQGADAGPARTGP